MVDLHGGANWMKRVLLVEDSVLVRTMVCDALQTCFPCVTTVTEDGSQALDELKVRTYDLVITDIEMPNVDGMQLLDSIRNDLSLDTPVIMLTSNTEKAMRKQAKRTGANAYLTKPVDYNELIKLAGKLVKI
jgi:two-component system chemotaxis response regulator CheY